MLYEKPLICKLIKNNFKKALKQMYCTQVNSDISRTCKLPYEKYLYQTLATSLSVIGPEGARGIENYSLSCP